MMTQRDLHIGRWRRWCWENIALAKAGSSCGDAQARRRKTGRSPGLFLGLLLAASGLAGCRTVGDPASGDLASIVVQGRSEEQIRKAVITVFMRENYVTGFSALRELVFERKGSAVSNWVYGGWPGADPPVWERVRVTFLPRPDGVMVVGCNAYVVNNRGENFFEEEQKLTQLHRNAYQKLLNKANELVKSMPPAS